MKTTLGMILCALTMACLPAHAESISLNVSSPVQVGSSFDVLVQVNDVFDGRAADDTVIGYGFNVTIGDGSVFQYTGESAGSLFDDFSGFPGGPMVAGLAANFAGIGLSDFSGPLTLAILHFDALSTGSTSIGVTWDSSDLNQGLVYAYLPYGAISASTTVIAAVPEPATLTMVFGGLLTLVAPASRRRGGRR